MEQLWRLIRNCKQCWIVYFNCVPVIILIQNEDECKTLKRKGKQIDKSDNSRGSGVFLLHFLHLPATSSATFRRGTRDLFFAAHIILSTRKIK